jgi:hypothetical protein
MAAQTAAVLPTEQGTATTSTADTPKRFKQLAGGCARPLICFADLSEDGERDESTTQTKESDMARKDKPKDATQMRIAIPQFDFNARMPELNTDYRRPASGIEEDDADIERIDVRDGGQAVIGNLK